MAPLAHPPLAGATFPTLPGRVANLYRPTAVARFLVRLEDFSNDDGPLAQREGEAAKVPGARVSDALAAGLRDQARRRASGEADLAADTDVALQRMSQPGQNPRAPVYRIPGPAPGLKASGNIDLANRPRVRNPDGSISTVRSLGVNVDGQEVLIPTVSLDGRIMSDEEAIATYKKTGQHLGKFDTPAHSTAYALRLHAQQESLLANPAPVPASKRRSRHRGPGGSDPAPPGGAAPDAHSATWSVVTLDAQVERNSFRIADKAQVKIALRDLPIHPQLVRSLFMEVWMGTVPPDDFARPDRWVPYLIDFGPPMFRGYVDLEQLVGSADNLEIVLQARSLEARLMDLKINPNTKERRIRGEGEKTSEYIRRLISTIPEFNGQLGDAIGVRFFPNVDPDREPILSRKLFLRSLQTAASRASAGGAVQAAPDLGGIDPALAPDAGTPVLQPPTPAAQNTLSVWDVIVRAAELSGVIPIYDPTIVAVEDGQRVPLGANNILLVPPQNLKVTPDDGVTIPGGPVDGFSRDLTLLGTRPIRSDVRFMVWGSNVREMRWERKYTRSKAPRVRVVCHNPDGGPGERTLQAVFPEESRATAVSAVGSGIAGTGKGHVPIEEEVVRVVRGIRDKQMLEQIAVSLYHQISRQELTVVVETDDLASYLDPTRKETHNENPDLLRLGPGTPCRVTVARRVEDPLGAPEVVGELSRLFDQRYDPAFLRRALIDAPGSGRFLSVRGREALERSLSRLEEAYRKADLRDWFYCRVVRHTMSASDGYSAEIELANYVEARSAPRSGRDRAVNDLRKMVKTGKRPDVTKARVLDGVEDVVRNLRGGFPR